MSAFAWRPVTAVASVVTALLLATANRYDYHRDELYFRILGRHPQWGYVDQPPFTPLLTRLSTLILGDSLWAIRVPSALMIGAMAFLTALIAREAGGGRAAQTLAACAVFGAFPLVGGHVVTTATPDLLVWLGVLFFVLRALLHDRPRAWLAAGAITGLGLYNKHLVLLLLVSLVAGILVLGPRRVLVTRWPWLGAALALVIGLPNLLYQVANHFPQADMAAAIAENKGTESRIELLPFQLILLGLFFVPIWIAGIVALLRDPALRPARSLAVAYPILLVLVLVTAGQPYYPMGLVTGLFAIGAVRASRWRVRWPLVAVNAAVSALFALPLLPVDRLGPIAEINSTVADQIGWREYVREIAGVYATLTPPERQRAVLFTSNYGEAGALDRYGPALGLPAAYSGHNELHHYGPPPESRTVAVVVSGTPPAAFGSCDLGTRLHNSAGVDNEELDASVFVCRHLPATWADMWPALQHYD
nr:glycosyltransferase family 39 protein [uncultured Actinoplanes sp.]